MAGQVSGSAPRLNSFSINVEGTEGAEPGSPAQSAEQRPGLFGDGFDSGPTAKSPVLQAETLYFLPDLKSGEVTPKLSHEITNTTLPALADQGFTEKQLDVPWKTQFADHGFVDGNGNPLDEKKACTQTAKLMMSESSGTQAKSGSDVDNFVVARAYDAKGRTVPSPEVARAGRAYIDGQLDANKPVMVGVHWNTPHPGRNDGRADHFVVITGRGKDDQGRVFYTFNDPGTKLESIGSDKRPENRFYVDARTGMLYREAVPADSPMNKQVAFSRFEVSQIRKNE